MKLIKDECDVLVVGGGTAGLVAAIQAARAGASTILIEMTSQLGGTITNCGVYGCAYFFAGKKQVVSGIGWELAKETIELSNMPMPDFDNPPRHRPSHPVMLDRYLFAMVSEEKVISSGTRLHYHEILNSLEWSEKDDRWIAQSTGKMRKRSIIAKEVVDCTGDAVAVRLAGGLCIKEAKSQPGTLLFALAGYDCDTLNERLIQDAYDEALKNGDLQPGDFCFTDQPFINYLKRNGGNLQHIFHADSSDSDMQTQANIQARQRLLAMIRFLRKLPGLEKVYLKEFNHEIGIRETYRIIGETVITKEDYLAGRAYDDAIAYTYYYVDIHHHDGIEYIFLEPEVYPVIPFSALIPKGMKHILTAGRTISSDRAAFSALRVQASCMAMGQAVGAAAAIGCKIGIPSREVPIAETRKLLQEHSAIIPE